MSAPPADDSRSADASETIASVALVMSWGSQKASGPTSARYAAGGGGGGFGGLGGGGFGGLDGSMGNPFQVCV